MSKLDRIKAEIDFHEKMFFVSIAVIFTVVGWLIEKAPSIGNFMLTGGLLVLIFAIAFSIWNYRQINALLEDLDNA